MKYANHPSIKINKELVDVPGFSLHEICLAEIETEINNLNANPENSPSAQHLKDHRNLWNIFI